MEDERRPPRREALSGALSLPSVVGLDASADTAARQARFDARVLVAGASRTGHARASVGHIRHACRAGIFESVPAEPSPEDDHGTARQAERDRRTGCETPLLAAVIRAFPSRPDLSGRALVPFIAHGASGAGSSRAVRAEHAPRMPFQSFTHRQHRSARRRPERHAGSAARIDRSRRRTCQSATSGLKAPSHEQME